MIFLSIILLLFVISSAFFSGSEIGMMSINRYRLRYLVKQKNKRAIQVNEMLTQPDRLLSVVLIGNTVANILASMIATLIGQRLYGDAGVAVATLVLTFVILVFSEMAPKTLAAIYPQQMAFAVSPLLKILQTLLAPLVQGISWITNMFLRIFGVSVEKVQREALSSEELRSIVHEAGGFLPIEHKSMLISLLDLEKATVEDVMIPKSAIVGLDLNNPWHEMVEQLENTAYTRLPIYENNIDNLIGVIHVRGILNLILEEDFNKESLRAIAEAPYFIPEAMSLNAQILNFRKLKKRSCFVVDEYGDLLGLVTLHDILEEIVGDFTSDISSLSRDILPQEDGSIIVDASSTLRHLNKLLGWNIPSTGPKTLSGTIIEYLGYIPPSNCCLKIENFQIEILKAKENLIQTVRIFRISKPN